MVKTISLNNGRVLKLAGLFVLTAIAVAFLAFPIVSFAKPNMTTVTAGKAFIISSQDGTSKPDDQFDPKTTTTPTDGSLELVQVTLTDGTQTLGVFLGKSKVEIVQNGKGTPAKIK